MGVQQNSHHEIWDDSALLQSWNEALNEYKKYHSIAARGERLKDVIDAAEKAESSGSTKVDDSTIDPNSGLPAWQAVDVHETANGSLEETGAQEDDEQPAHQPDVQQTVPPGPSPNSPQALLSSVQDENLKNLMMSWYYAGYYTGLHEGQQKAQATQKSAH